MKIQITIHKSPIPIVWLDTSIISYMTKWKHNLGKMDKTNLTRISSLYNQIYEMTRAEKILCPLAEQESEIWVQRDKWLETIHSLALGIRTAARQTIHDSQFYRFMDAYVKKEDEIVIDYKDAFLDDPVKELKETLKLPVYVYVKSSILFGEDYARNLKNNILESVNAQGKKNIKSGITFEKQLEAEYMGDLQALIIQRDQVLSGQFKDEWDKANAISGVMKLYQQLQMWENCSGKANDLSGLIGFYKSHYYRSMPYTDLSCNITANFMINKQDIRSGDYMDINHVATLMPYSDLFITDKAMSTFLKKKGFDKKYNTAVCYIGDTKAIESLFHYINENHDRP